MLLVPAIDILDGKVVRLYQGRKERKKVYFQNPCEVAKMWQERGASLIHIVDLNASLGEGNNLEVIEEILKLKIKSQVAGGIRDLGKIEKLLAWGAERVVIGTKALEERFLKKVINLCGEKVAVSVDVSGEKVSCEGWKKRTEIDYLEFIHFLEEKGVKYVIYTDILRDGTLKGINIEKIKKLSSFKEIFFVIGGGVKDLGDLELIKKEASFIKGVILGKALYEGRIDFEEAKKFCNSQ